MHTQLTCHPWLLQFVGNGSLLERFHQAYWLGLATTAWPVFKWMDPLVLGGARALLYDSPQPVLSAVIGRDTCTWHR